MRVARDVNVRQRVSPPTHDKSNDKSAAEPHDEGRGYAVRQLVEPWNRVEGSVPQVQLSYGEGMYYNARLHTVTALQWVSRLRRWYRRVWTWLSRTRDAHA